MQTALFQYCLRLGDNALILGHRLSEWCGHGPILEVDMALTNIALDLVGQARNWLKLAGEVEGKGRSEDDLAYLRQEREYLNVLLVEQPNTDFAYTVVRQFLFDAFNFYLHQKLTESKDERLAAFAEKALKEVTYHLRYSSEWMIRLGDGTEESHAKTQQALDDLWMYSGEALQADGIDAELAEAGIGVDLGEIQPLVEEKIATILQEATLKKPTDTFMQSGGKQGRHTEHMGFILTELQYMQRTYPGLEW